MIEHQLRLSSEKIFRLRKFSTKIFWISNFYAWLNQEATKLKDCWNGKNWWIKLPSMLRVKFKISLWVLRRKFSQRYASKSYPNLLPRKSLLSPLNDEWNPSVADYSHESCTNFQLIFNISECYSRITIPPLFSIQDNSC